MSTAPHRIEDESGWPLFATLTLNGRPCPAFLAHTTGIQNAELAGEPVVLLAMRLEGQPALYQPIDRLTGEALIASIRQSLDEAGL